MLWFHLGLGAEIAPWWRLPMLWFHLGLGAKIAPWWRFATLLLGQLSQASAAAHLCQLSFPWSAVSVVEEKRRVAR
jgi:hypothetical protein